MKTREERRRAHCDPIVFDYAMIELDSDEELWRWNEWLRSSEITGGLSTVKLDEI